VARIARQTQPDAVLTHFAEYLAPLWAWRFRQLSRSGIRLATVLHDPLRDHIVGPRWWHRWSVREAFSFIDLMFIHGEVDSPELPSKQRRVGLPHGTYDLVPADASRPVIRRDLDIPENAQVLISYGYVRDNKNLDLVLRAIAQFPDLWLIVAGAEQDGGNRPLAFYRALAEELGCGDRCRWLARFLDREETANLFAASDLNLLTYSSTFVSASGVLATAAYYRLPSLVSGGLASTRALIAYYGLGIWVEPDDEDAIVAGLRTWLAGRLTPDWDRYHQDHSWQRNAEIVAAALGGNPATAPIAETGPCDLVTRREY
jgi:glycosyltransferase involved in cell wall biosynthesis